jgi:RNA polymerase sigma-70 factor, ECF subfamily
VVNETLEDHIASLYRFAMRLTRDSHDAEDLTQEAFLKAWRHRGQVRNPHATRVWLFRIAENLWRDRLRRKKRSEGKEVPFSEDLALVGRSRERGTPEGREEAALVLRALDSLPPRQREVLYLHAFEGLSNEEIAEVTESHNGTVRTNLSIARKALREKLDRLLSD